MQHDPLKLLEVQRRPRPRSSRRLWRAWFNGALYIPEEGRHVLLFLEAGGPPGFLAELEKLAALGSPWASAILGYMALMPGEDGKRNINRAVELCKTHAHAGDEYAQYVYAWALLFLGETNRAYGMMKSGLLSQFPPATLDYTAYVWHGWGTKEPYPALALKLLRHAKRASHALALEWRCRFYRTGNLGLARRTLGSLLMPLALLRHIIAAWRDPFSCRVFVFQRGATRPLLRSKPRFVP
jgi:hypothetical protein